MTPLTIEIIKTYENKTIEDSETGDFKTYSVCCPFMTQQERRQWLSENCVALWGDQMYDAHMEMLRNETPEERAARLKAEAAADEKMYDGVVNFSMERKNRKWGMKWRIAKPCKYATLFAKRICARCEKHVPEGEDTCSGTAEKPHLPEKLAGCWSHTKKECIYIHPDEPWYADACAGILDYDRKGIDEEKGWEEWRFFRKGDVPPTVSRGNSSRFAILGVQSPKPRHSGHSGRSVPSGRSYESSRFAEKPRAPKAEVETAW